LKGSEAKVAYNCLKGALKAGYSKSGDATAKGYMKWANYSTTPYQSATHGSRYVNNYANAAAKAYGKYEAAGKMPVGAIIAKDSFMAAPGGDVTPGPLFVMEKMLGGFNKPSGDWRYTMIMASGKVAGMTNGKGSNAVAFCIECHASVANQDHLFFMPEDVRK
jgi:hypothetical protein